MATKDNSPSKFGELNKCSFFLFIFIPSVFMPTTDFFAKSNKNNNEEKKRIRSGCCLAFQ